MPQGIWKTVDPHSAVTFIDFASTGATIERGLLKPQRQWQKEGQLEELRVTVQK